MCVCVCLCLCVREHRLASLECAHTHGSSPGPMCVHVFDSPAMLRRVAMLRGPWTHSTPVNSIEIPCVTHTHTHTASDRDRAEDIDMVGTPSAAADAARFDSNFHLSGWLVRLRLRFFSVRSSSFDRENWRRDALLGECSAAQCILYVSVFI